MTHAQGERVVADGPSSMYRTSIAAIMARPGMVLIQSPA